MRRLYPTMWGLELVRPLEDDWRETLDEVGRARGFPTSRDAARLSTHVQALSAAYNDSSLARAMMRDAGAARLGFSFARDVPKAAGAVRELVATGAFARPMRERPLRVLDVGAGLGAMTWGLVRALETWGQRGQAGQTGHAVPVAVEATWIDSDAAALDLALAIVRARERRGGLGLRVRTLVRPAERVDGLGSFDVILLGNVLSEMSVDASDPVRLERHVALIQCLLALAPGAFDFHGALVIVEPALRDRTRHLHRVRDALAALGFHIFAPCLHAEPCPALRGDGDWCHEDLPVDLPSWLVPVAHGAGLRHQGLTFSYLVVRRGGGGLAAAVPAPASGERRNARLRVVSGPIRTKRKREAFLCGEFAPEGAQAAEASADAANRPPLVAGRARVMRLDRDAVSQNAAFEDINRGTLVVVSPPPALARPRIGSTHSVCIAPIDTDGAPDRDSR